MNLYLPGHQWPLEQAPRATYKSVVATTAHYLAKRKLYYNCCCYCFPAICFVGKHIRT